ncbi:hypothetical protein [Pseudomonas shirazensis]
MDRNNALLRDRLTKALDKVFDARLSPDISESDDRIEEALMALVSDPDSKQSQSFFDEIVADDSESSDESIWKGGESPLEMACCEDINDENDFFSDDYVYERQQLQISSDNRKPAQIVKFPKHPNFSQQTDYFKVLLANNRSGIERNRVVLGSTNRHEINYLNIYEFFSEVESILLGEISQTSSMSISKLRVRSHEKASDLLIHSKHHEPDVNCFELSLSGKNRVIVEVRPYALIMHFSAYGNKFEDNPYVVVSPVQLDSAASNMAHCLNGKQGYRAPLYAAGILDFVKAEIDPNLKALR